MLTRATKLQNWLPLCRYARPAVCRTRPGGHTESLATRSFQTSARRLDRSFANILADDTPLPVQVSSIGEQGIQLADGLKIPGACIFLDGRVFLWDVPAVGETAKNRWDGWTKEHFEMLETVVPVPEILLFGTGKKIVQPPPFLRAYLNEKGIQLDVLDTRNACATYNLLAEEGRRVGAALLPFSGHEWRKSTPSSS